MHSWFSSRFEAGVSDDLVKFLGGLRDLVQLGGNGLEIPGA
jgi:hypothetical protein